MDALTAEALKELVHYDPVSGLFRWVTASRFGQPAGRPNNGYMRLSLGKWGTMYAHRLAWLYMTGEMPEKHVDHIDCERSNNAWSNLRLATPDQNRANTRRTKRNTAGAKGVCHFRGGYRAAICVKGQHIWLGDYNSVEEASAAYAGAAKVAFGEFARTA